MAGAVTERPILFSGPMVRAILARTKTQTRRLIKPQPTQGSTEAFVGMDGIWRFSQPTARCPVSHATDDVRCPYGQPGDRLWVRETWRPVGAFADMAIKEIGKYFHSPATAMSDHLRFKADDKPHDGGDAEPWLPSIHMPRWASRITLEITAVRVERLQDISPRDAVAEGLLCREGILETWWGNGFDGSTPSDDCYFLSPVECYRVLWDSINANAPWESNPFVWVVEFKRLP